MQGGTTGDRLHRGHSIRMQHAIIEFVGRIPWQIRVIQVVTLLPAAGRLGWSMESCTHQ